MTYAHFSTSCADHHGLVRDFGGDGPRPKIVVLCGSTRFVKAFHQANLHLTLAGHIVLSIGCDTKSDADLIVLGELIAEAKAKLDELHLRKIDLADEVLVVSDESGYFGESTEREIRYATAAGKPVTFLWLAAGERWAALAKAEAVTRG